MMVCAYNPHTGEASRRTAMIHGLLTVCAYNPCTGEASRRTVMDHGLYYRANSRLAKCYIRHPCLKTIYLLYDKPCASSKGFSVNKMDRHGWDLTQLIDKPLG